jgi:putative redox protein
MELVLMGTGACASFDVVDFLRRGREDVVDCVCELEAERADAVPAVFTAVRMHFVVTGNDLSEAKVARAVRLSADKYCSASIMLGAAGVEVTHTHEVRQASDH